MIQAEFVYHRNVPGSAANPLSGQRTKLVSDTPTTQRGLPTGGHVERGTNLHNLFSHGDSSCTRAEGLRNVNSEGSLDNNRRLESYHLLTNCGHAGWVRSSGY
jgi:hypothetical protein